MNIFLMRARVPFLPLPSNTWKIEETLKLVGYPFPPLQYYGELSPALNRLLDMREEFKSNSADSYIRGRNAFDPLLKELQRCIS